MMKRRLKNGQVKYNTLLTPLLPEQVMQLLGREVEQAADAHQVMVAYAELYDLRGGAVETSDQRIETRPQGHEAE